MSIDDVRDYRNELAGFLEARLLQLSPFRADIERRERQEAEAREMITAVWPIVETLPTLPPFEYDRRRTRHFDGIAYLGGDRYLRELVLREEQVRVWEATVESISGFVDFYAKRGIPVSGDDRPDVRHRRALAAAGVVGQEGEIRG